VLAADENRAAAAGQLQALVDAARAGPPPIQAAAARALGRLERRDVIRHLLPLLSARDVNLRSEVANAVAQSFRGEPLADTPSGQQVEAALQALVASPRGDGLHRAVGRLPYETVDQFRAAETFLLQPLLSADPPASVARAFDSLGRRRPGLAPLSEQAVERLREIASRRTPRTLAPDVRRNAMAALVTWQGADRPTVEAALGDDEFEIRRLAVLVIAGAGAVLTPDERGRFLDIALQDRSPHVRLEAVRAWARRAAADHGCAPLLHALRDTDLHVVLAALDALGEQCTNDDQITDYLAAEARTPPVVGPWQREAHAFVALAKRSRERAAIAMSAFSMHSDWQVRMYAARAAIAMDDLDSLRRLAADPDDNVVEVTLAPLRKRLGAAANDVFVAALNRRARTTGREAPERPYQAWREAAIQLQGAEANGELVAAVGGALQRATADRCLTSRDTRLALIARIVELGSPAQLSLLAPLLKDIDPKVAEAAAAGIEKWTGSRPAVEPQPRQPDLPSPDVLAENPLVIVEMEGGRMFRMAFHPDQAPLAKARFRRLVRLRYYNDLTFHRVVPNFVIQGGSPNANEYCGDCPFMRDEVGLEMHVRGTVGVSTRGRDTGDAQIFVNLVDNPRLDHEYTVLAHVCRSDMDVVDRIHEGDRMRRVRLQSGRCE
jgi:cyclophilin family peptidyl-prolyl cis-trans isomerase/HEAT repeat protein